MAEDRDVQRRPEPGVRWRRTGDFVDRLSSLLEAKTSTEVAHEVSERIGYEIDDSMIRKLRDKDLDKTPSSVLIGPICRVYGWPVPPVADPNPEFGEAMSVLYELQGGDHDTFAQVLEFASHAVRALRAKSELEAKYSPANPDDSET